MSDATRQVEQGCAADKSSKTVPQLTRSIKLHNDTYAAQAGIFNYIGNILLRVDMAGSEGALNNNIIGLGNKI